MVFRSCCYASITVSDEYANCLTGICGDFDGNSSNDLKQSDNIDESLRKVSPSHAEIGDSYIVSDPENLGNTLVWSLFSSNLKTYKLNNLHY